MRKKWWVEVGGAEFVIHTLRVVIVPSHQHPIQLGQSGWVQREGAENAWVWEFPLTSGLHGMPGHWAR